MMLANVPAVLLGDRIAEKMPVKLVHAVAAAIFALLGIATLLERVKAWVSETKNGLSIRQGRCLYFGARRGFRTPDPRRVKAMLYH